MSVVSEVSHRDVGDELADVVQCSELVGVETLVRFKVGDFDAEQVVEVASDVVTFDDSCDLARTLLEALDVFALMAHEANCNESGESTVIGFRVDDCPVAPDHKLILKASEPARTCRC